MRMRRIGVLFLGALFIGGVLRAPAWPQTGTTFTVTRFDDPVPDACNPGDCSLREAVIDASAAIGTPTIVLPAGTFVLSRVGPEAPGTRDLDVTGDLAITGAGADLTVIDANGAVTNVRVFEIYGLSALQLTGVTAGGGRRGPGRERRRGPDGLIPDDEPFRGHREQGHGSRRGHQRRTQQHVGDL